MSSDGRDHWPREDYRRKLESLEESHQLLARKHQQLLDEAADLEAEVERLRKHLYVTQVALTNLVSGAEQIHRQQLPQDEGLRAIWDGNIEQANRVLPPRGERPKGNGENASLAEAEIEDALDGEEVAA